MLKIVICTQRVSGRLFNLRSPVVSAVSAYNPNEMLRDVITKNILLSADINT